MKRVQRMERSGRARWVSLALAAALVAAGCGGGPEEAPRRDDDAAARAMFDRAIEADLRGDALGSQDLMFDLAVRHPDTAHGRAARARVGSDLIGLYVAGVAAAVAIPAVMKYIRRSKTHEATMNVRKMYDAAVMFYVQDPAQRGEKAPRFPATTGLTPDRPFCADGDEFEPSPEAWAEPGWRELGFALDGPHAYRYQFVSEGTGAGARFTARALGDLNCDGVLSTFERVGWIDREGNVTGGAGLYTNQELE